LKNSTPYQPETTPVQTPYHTDTARQQPRWRAFFAPLPLHSSQHPNSRLNTRTRLHLQLSPSRRIISPRTARCTANLQRP
jgi:hypothetical protein